MEYNEIIGCTIANRLQYLYNQDNKDEANGKLESIHQEIQAEEASDHNDNTSLPNAQNMSIKMKKN